MVIMKFKVIKLRILNEILTIFKRLSFFSEQHQLGIRKDHPEPEQQERAVPQMKMTVIPLGSVLNPLKES